MLRYFISVIISLSFILIGYIIYPLHILCGRKMGRVFFTTYGRCMLYANTIKLEIEGLDNIDKNKRYLIVSNHQSLFDIPIIFAFLPLEIKFFAKKELRKIPLMGGLLAIYDHVFVDRNNKRDALRSLKRAQEILSKYSFGMFPEGTRSIDGKIGKFKAPGLSIAQKAGVEVLPIAIKGSMNIIKKDHLFVNSGTVFIRIFPPVKYEENEDRKDFGLYLENMIKEFVEN